MDIIVFPGESFFSKTERKRDKEENEYLNDYREIIFRFHEDAWEADPEE